MVKLKKTIGQLKVGNYTIDHNTPQETINELLESRPDLKSYFSESKSTNKTKKNGKKSEGGNVEN